MQLGKVYEKENSEIYSDCKAIMDQLIVLEGVNVYDVFNLQENKFSGGQYRVGDFYKKELKLDGFSFSELVFSRQKETVKWETGVHPTHHHSYDKLSCSIGFRGRSSNGASLSIKICSPTEAEYWERSDNEVLVRSGDKLIEECFSHYQRTRCVENIENLKKVLKKREWEKNKEISLQKALREGKIESNESFHKLEKVFNYLFNTPEAAKVILPLIENALDGSNFLK